MSHFFALAVVGSLSQHYSLITWLLLVNILTFLVYGMDKYAAKNNFRRVSESTLLFFGFAGGWPAALCGQEIFRHKTKKQPFREYFVISITLNIGVLGIVGALYWRYIYG
ncbi:DUF1294 domain-containing protein [Klebsiella sp. BIGb0407]|uniref:DUF1294 domain-containing protein n=1 Tax=Klebsiella sp. BIGb0407 TaxID=2940603 RepID=UPI0021689418|nr:DUF1294 domain-containing protein [Klebsiella sp. BIGb0407]